MADDVVRAGEAIFSRKNARVESDTTNISANSEVQLPNPLRTSTL